MDICSGAGGYSVFEDAAKDDFDGISEFWNYIFAKGKLIWGQEMLF